MTHLSVCSQVEWRVPRSNGLKDVLVVEDNPGDLDLIREAFEHQQIHHRLHCVRNGQAAVEFLNRTRTDATAPKPDLIILDLNVPKVDGLELLHWLKAEPSFSLIPTVVFSTSHNPSDVFASYAMQANCYAIKPSDPDCFFETIGEIVHFWLSTVVLPPNSPLR